MSCDTGTHVNRRGKVCHFVEKKIMDRQLPVVKGVFQEHWAERISSEGKGVTGV
jgi:hypothetical protein